ncbi:MAG: hypothetical protein JWO38_7336 [Gemmataceae bacterium]|nr:hypothetical protein [Gemmataceae bacterium]
MLTFRIRSGRMPSIGRLTFGLVWFLGCAELARAQPYPAPSMPAASVTVPPTGPSFTPAPHPAYGLSVPETGPVSCPTPHPHDEPGRGEGGLLDAITGSIFGHPDPSTWTALPLSTFFTEGWRQPWVGGPDSDGGAPRHGWINAFDGLFYRQVVGTFTYDNHFHNNGDQYVGDFTLFLPLNRRLELRLDVPVVSNVGGPSNRYHNNIGDLVITPVFQLSESKNFSQTLSCFITVPTGKLDNGQHQTLMAPQYQFWAGLPDAWVVRGGVGTTVPLNNVGGPRTTMDYNLAFGKFITPAGKDLFSATVLYLAANGHTAVDNRGPSGTTFFSLTPGIRSHIVNNWFLLSAVEVPVTGPTSNTFAWSTIVQIVKGF